MDKLRKVLSGQETTDNDSGENGGIQEIIDSSSLSWSTRVKGFVICFVVGFAFSIMGSIFLFFAKTVTFAIFYSLGSLLSIGSTMFLMGPINQIKKMFASTRVIATVVMIGSVILTLFFAFHTKKALISLIFVIIQFLAMTWYSLSYIPFARDSAKKLLSGIFC